MSSKNTDKTLFASLDNPFAETDELEFTVPGQVASAPGLYENSLIAGWEL